MKSMERKNQNKSKFPFFGQYTIIRLIFRAFVQLILIFEHRDIGNRKEQQVKQLNQQLTAFQIFSYSGYNRDSLLRGNFRKLE